MTGRVGVAISTTGEQHRLGFLETCVRSWRQSMPANSSLFVTVDGSLAEAEAARLACAPWSQSVWRLGAAPGRRQGVAVNKNTGIEALMDAGVDHLFLSDDDSWPLHTASLSEHIELSSSHSMVCWGKSRWEHSKEGYAAWNWPRGVMLYQHRAVVEAVGGMDERFGPGGHEHAEYSQRIFNAGFTSTPFVSPAVYATRGAMGARALWHCEDMPREGEMGGDWLSRKRRNTTIKREAGDWTQIHKIMAEREGSSDFVPYRAADNGRASATLCQDLTGRAEVPTEPRSQE